jgi:hypothetical protein
MRAKKSRVAASAFCFVAFCIAACLAVVPALAGNVTTVEGTICTSGFDAPITDTQLQQMISQNIPASSQSLIMMDQCFGANSAQAFAGLGNTAVISSTSIGQVAFVGAYGPAATTALAPGADNTGETVQAAGTSTVFGGQRPSQLGDGNGGTPNTGNLNPANFSLAPVNPISGPVTSRHILIYAGEPTSDDTTAIQNINNNFEGQPDTTITTVGDNGETPWQQPGTAAGLEAALQQIGQTISNSPNPVSEQFIMYVGDHGGLTATQLRTTRVYPYAQAPLTDTTNITGSPGLNSSLITFDDDDFGGVIAAVQPPQPVQVNAKAAIKAKSAAQGVTVDESPTSPTPLQIFQMATTQGGFSCFVDLSSTGNNDPMPISELSSVFSSWVMNVTIQTGPNAGTDFTLTDPTLEPTDLDGDSTLGDTPGEGVTLLYPVDPSLLAGELFGVNAEIDITAGGGLDSWLVSDPSEYTGDIPLVPEPSAIGLLGAAAAYRSISRRKRA